VSWRSLVRKRDFQTVYEEGAKRVGRLVVVYLLAPETGQGPAGGQDFARAVVASKKVGNAVARNRAKRLLREAHRLGVLGQLGDSSEADHLRRVCERLVWGPGGQEAGGDDTGKISVAKKAAAAAERNTFAGLWVVLVARRRILSANIREVKEELDTLLKFEPQLQ